MSIEIFAKQIHPRNIPDNGVYYLTPFNIFKDYLKVFAIDGKFFIDKKTPASDDVLNDYSHFTPYLEDVDLGDCYIDYEDIVEVETFHLEELNCKAYALKDRSDRPFFIYYDGEHFCFDIKDQDVSQAMFVDRMGWHDFPLNDNIEILNQVKLTSEQLLFIIETLSHFQKTEMLNFDNCTERGFKIEKFEMINGEEFTLQESSIATEAAVWFGVCQPSIKVDDVVYKNESDFINAINNNSVDGINCVFPVKMLSLPSRIEITKYHIEPMLTIFNEIIHDVLPKN